MRVHTSPLLLLAPLVSIGCADARTGASPEAAPAEAVTVAVPAVPAPPEPHVAEPAPSSPSSLGSVETPLAKGQLPVICEAYFAKFRQCIEATLRRHPDETTRITVAKQFEKAEQSSRAMMTAGMEPKDAEAYCKQALEALTISSCE
jgi:hypothetical protein